MATRATALLALAAFALSAGPALANDPNYAQTVFVHTRGLTSEFTGEVRIAYTFDGRRETKEKKAMGELPSRFVVPSMAKDVEVEGKFARRGGPTLTVVHRSTYFSESVMLDFTSQVRK